MAKFILLLFFLSFTAQASEPWTTEEKTLEATYLVLTVIDWKQTRYISDHPRYSERNILISEHPSHREVDRFFIAHTAIHLVVVDALGHKWRKRVQWITIAEKSWNIWRNHQIGIRMEF